MTADGKCSYLGVTDLDACRVRVGIELGAHFETHGHRRCDHQLHDGPMALWLSRGFARPFLVMNVKRQCSTLFYLLVWRAAACEFSANGKQVSQAEH